MKLLIMQFSPASLLGPNIPVRTPVLIHP